MSAKPRPSKRSVNSLQEIDALMLEQQAQQEHQTQVVEQAEVEVLKSQVERLPEKGYVSLKIRHHNGQLDTLTISISEWITMCSSLNTTTATPTNAQIVHPFGKEV